jgi:DNA-binding IclR family transcriptional regulator
LAKVVYKAPALDKGLEILELLAGQPRPMTMPEIAQALGRSKTEIYRMLVVLETRGYIRRGEHDDRYQITSRLFELGMRNAPKRNLHDAAMPAMHELAESVRQSCHLAVVAGAHIVIIARVESPTAVGFAVRMGHLVPILDSASGRVLFGGQPPALQAALLESIRAGAPSKKAVDSFVAESRAAAKAGYLVEQSRVSEGIRDIAAPIFDGEALGAVASLTVPYLSYRYSAANVDDVIAQVVETAKRISERLKHG